MFSPSTRLVLVGLAALGLLSPTLSGTAEARDRYAAPPPLVLSPDLSSPWTLQLRAAPRIVQRAAAPRTNRKLAVSRTYRAPAARAGISTAPQQAALRHTIEADIDAELLPATVAWNGSESPGTVIVDTPARRLFLVLPGGKARRYAVGVGKPGFEWAGNHKVSRKSEWPDWRPPAEMIARERRKGRELPSFMPGGPSNPLGARALYLGSSIYRIHGTNQAWSIGKAVSSGCIRMRNEDVMDLYDRVPVGARVRVI